MSGDTVQSEFSPEVSTGKRPVNAIIGELGPAKSGKAYDLAWKRFVDFTGNDDKPNEDSYLQFFDFLKRQHGYKASSFWSLYSKLNSVHQRTYGNRLQDFPRVKLLLKTYEEGYSRKVAKTFTVQEIKSFIQLELEGPFWILRKAFVAISYFGGLRGEEAHRLKQGDLMHDEAGYHVTFCHAKQVGEQKSSCFLVPYNRDRPSECFATKIFAYLSLLESTLQNVKKEDPLFFGCSGGKKFVHQPMGKRLLQQIGKDVARVLQLPQVDNYTGHAWRRSAATEAAGQGATSNDLKRKFNWKSEATALRYLDNTEAQSVKMAQLLTGERKITSESKKSTVLQDKEGHTNQCNMQYVYNIDVGDNCTLNF